MRKRIRLQRCPGCKKRIVNHGQSLSYDLYIESGHIENGVNPKEIDKNTTYCKKCSSKARGGEKKP